MNLSEEDLQALYSWVDEIPLSRPKRNIARDFSDGVLLAEIMYHYFPKLVELHNYSSANAAAQKMYNWNTLNQRVFKRLGFQIHRSDCEEVVNAVPGAIEGVLLQVKNRISQYRRTRKSPSKKTLETGPPSGRFNEPPYIAYKGSHEDQVYRGSPAKPQPHQDQSQNHDSYSLDTSYAYGVDPSDANRAMAEKDANIQELKETNEILETKVRKLEQLVRLKDAKIQTLLAKMRSAGLGS